MTIEPTSYNPPISFRALGVTQKQLRQLKRKWGANQSQVIMYCIERAWQQEFGNQQSEKPVKERMKV